MGRELWLLHGQRHDGHGGGLDDGGVAGVGVCGGAGANGGFLAHVCVGLAGGCGGRYDRPAAFVVDDADRAGAGRGGVVDGVVGRCGGHGHGVVLHAAVWLLHGGADAGLEFHGRRDAAARGVAACDSVDEHGLQRRAGAGASAGGSAVCLAGIGLGVCLGLWRDHRYVVGDSALAAQAPSLEPFAGRTGLGRHAGGAALRAPFQTHAGAAVANGGIWRHGLGAVGAVAGDRSAAFGFGR